MTTRKRDIGAAVPALDPTAPSRHPGLRMNVYRVNRQTLTRTPVSSMAFQPSDATEPESLVYPPCRCARCKRPALAVAG